MDPGRGWNDPPKLDLVGPPTSSTTAAGVGKRAGLNLNKRVAFPLSAAASPSTAARTSCDPTAPPPLVPPIGASPLPPSSCTLGGTPPPRTEATAADPHAAPDDFDCESSLLETTDNFASFISEAVDLEHRADIERRLEEMKKMWMDLKKPICFKLLLISKALSAKDMETANTLQLSLVSAWPAETSKFAAAVRCLVNHLRQATAQNQSSPDPQTCLPAQPR